MAVGSDLLLLLIVGRRVTSTPSLTFSLSLPLSIVQLARNMMQMINDGREQQQQQQLETTPPVVTYNNNADEPVDDPVLLPPIVVAFEHYDVQRQNL